jgi:hypothetical protein
VYDANRFIYNRTRGWPKNEVPAIPLTEFHALRRNHIKRQFKMEGDRHEVASPMHLRRTLDQLDDREERERNQFVHPVQ